MGIAKTYPEAKKRRARRIGAHSFMLEESPGVGWVPHTRVTEPPRFSGDFPRRRCPWLPNFSEDILKRLWHESHSKATPGTVDHKDLPPTIKRRRASNAVLRRERSERRASGFP